jgi:hypothetical protein
MTDPERYPLDKKPLELNLYGNGPCSKAPAQHHWQHQTEGLVPQHAAPQPTPGQPYGYFHPTVPQPMYYYPPGPPPPPPGYAYGPPPVAAGPPMQPPAPKRPVTTADYPMISAWLLYCDHHLQCQGENFSGFADKFDKEDFRRMHQLKHMTVQQLADWLRVL